MAVDWRGMALAFAQLKEMTEPSDVDTMVKEYELRAIEQDKNLAFKTAEMNFNSLKEEYQDNQREYKTMRDSITEMNANALNLADEYVSPQFSDLIADGPMKNTKQLEQKNSRIAFESNKLMSELSQMSNIYKNMKHGQQLRKEWGGAAYREFYTDVDGNFFDENGTPYTKDSPDVTPHSWDLDNPGAEGYERLSENEYKIALDKIIEIEGTLPDGTYDPTRVEGLEHGFWSGFNYADIKDDEYRAITTESIKRKDEKEDISVKAVNLQSKNINSTNRLNMLYAKDYYEANELKWDSQYNTFEDYYNSLGAEEAGNLDADVTMWKEKQDIQRKNAPDPDFTSKQHATYGGANNIIDNEEERQNARTAFRTKANKEEKINTIAQGFVPYLQNLMDYNLNTEIDVEDGERYLKDDSEWDDNKMNATALALNEFISQLKGVDGTITIGDSVINPLNIPNILLPNNTLDEAYANWEGKNYVMGEPGASNKYDTSWNPFSYGEMPSPFSAESVFNITTSPTGQATYDDEVIKWAEDRELTAPLAGFTKELENKILSGAFRQLGGDDKENMAILLEAKSNFDYVVDNFEAFRQGTMSQDNERVFKEALNNMYDLFGDHFTTSRNELKYTYWNDSLTAARR
tara:strand:+ start:12397 stop:14298 length:1902 start_codon:yes stop_codon:yes gene_type:complete